MDYLWQNKHFIITHFPIVLLIFGFLFDLSGLLFKKKDLHLAGLISLITGTIGTIAAVLTGPEENRNPGVHTHEMYGRMTMYVSIVLSIVRLYILWRKKKDIGRHPIYLIGALAAAVLVGYTGHLGGEMVHRAPGQGPMGQMGGFGGQGGQDGQGGQGRQDNSGGPQAGGDAGGRDAQSVPSQASASYP